MGPRSLALATAVALPIAGCATANHHSGATVDENFSDAAITAGKHPRSAAAAKACRLAAQTELANIARRVYDQVAQGRNVTSSVHRVQRSTALASAVESRDRAAAAAALQSLLSHQIQRIDVFDVRGRRIAAVGRGPALAPARGELKDASGRVAGRYVLSVSNDHNYAGVVRRITAAPVILSAGARRVFSSSASSRVHYRAFTIAARAYPSGPLKITLLAPPLPLRSCGATSAQTALNTIGFVGRRLLRAEGSSRAVRRTLHYAAHDPAFRAAVVAADPAAIRAAIVDRFFKNGRYHIVRVRVMRGTRLIQDVGGPYALSPASAAVRGPDGRVAGRVTLSVQDDTGYIKLMHRFTGAAVLLRTRAGTVPGSSLDPGPPSVPSNGIVGYDGRRYRAYTFTGTAFPSDPLQISLLVPG